VCLEERIRRYRALGAEEVSNELLQKSCQLRFPFALLHMSEALVASTANFYLFNPFREQNLVGCETAHGIGVEDRIDHVTALTPTQDLDGPVPGFFPTVFEILVKEFIFTSLCDSPEVSACSHGHVNDTASPDIDCSRIELLVDVLLRSDVRSRAAKSSGHVGLLLPSHAEAFTVTEIGDLDGAMLGEKEILRLQVSVRNAHLMHLFDSAHELLKETVGFGDIELPRREN